MINQLVKYSHKVYEKEFVSATDGNLSVRLDDNKIAVTRSAINKGEITEQDIVIVDLKGNKISGNGKASTETKIHLLAYNSRKDINAVVHCHPTYATAFATAGLDLTEPVFPEVILGLGPVPLCKYATPSTDELPDSMKPHINYAWAMLLQNHGAITFGNSLEEAFNRMEKLEHAAKTLFLAKLLGGAIELNSGQVNKLYSIAEKTYGIKVNAKINGKNNLTKQAGLNIDSLTNSELSFTEIIEARLRARAGNPVFNNTNKKFNNDEKKNKLLNSSKDAIAKLIKDFNS